MAESDLDAARKTIARFGRAFRAPAVDVEELVELWDADYANPIYQPEELAEPLRSPDEVRRYFEALPSHINGVSDVRPLDFHVDVIGDVAHCYSRAYVSLDIVDRDEPLNGEVRQTFVLRRADGDWKFVHYHESRLTPGLEDAR